MAYRGLIKIGFIVMLALTTAGIQGSPLFMDYGESLFGSDTIMNQGEYTKSFTDEVGPLIGDGFVDPGQTQDTSSEEVPIIPAIVGDMVPNRPMRHRALRFG